MVQQRQSALEQEVLQEIKLAEGGGLSMTSFRGLSVRDLLFFFAAKSLV
eukprot:gene6786-9957_t